MAVVATDTKTTESEAKAWTPRPRAAGLTRVVVFLLPVVIATLVAVVVAGIVERPSGAMPTLLWFGLLFGVATGTVVVVERLARRLLPIASLLELTLVFPDHTPSRFAVALRAGLVGRPDRQLQRLIDTGQEEAVESVLALVMSLGAHDRRTQGHSERVRAYAEVIADELRLTLDERNRLRWSALLHDIGKLAVHPHVLQKEEALDDEEWEQIRRHPEEGARLVSTLVPWLGEWAAVVAQHHERWDGTGYPAGLQGTEITLGGRIVAVADAFEVMTAGRTYAGAIASPSARAELERCAGSQFDPTVVRAFLNAGLEPVGWASRFAAFFGALAVTGRQPTRDLATRATKAVAAGVVAVAVAGALPAASPPDLEVAADVADEAEEAVRQIPAQVAGVSVERDVPPPADIPEVADPVAEEPATEPLPPAPTVPEPLAPVDAVVPVIADATPVAAVVPPEPAPPAPIAPEPEPAPPAVAETPPPPPPPPSGFARDDTATTTGRPLRISVLENDGVDGATIDPASLEVVDAADHSNGRPGGANGTVTGDGVIAYIPEPKFVGVDSITYRVCTTTGVCETASVLVDVTGR